MFRLKQMSVDLVYPSAKLPNDWYHALNLPAIRYVRYHCGFDEDPEYILQMKKGEIISTMSYLPADLTEDCYKVYIKRGDYVKPEVRLTKFGVRVPKDTDHVKVLPVYIETGKSPEKIKMFQIVKRITELLNNNKFAQALEYMRGFPMTPDILHFTRKCHNLMNNREAAISTELLPGTLNKGWSQYDAMCQANFEFSAACFYLGDLRSAYYHQDALIHDRRLARYLCDGYLRNICNFYLSQLLSAPGEPEKRVKIYTQVPHPAKYHLMNISLLNFDSEMAEWLHEPDTVALGFARTVNYLLKDGVYISMHDDRRIRTQTYLIWLNRELEVIKHVKIRLAVDYHKKRYTQIEDLEDMRIFRYPSGDIGFTATGIDTHSHQSHQMVMGTLNENAEINKMILLHYADWRYQKNWLAFSHNGEVLMVYKYNPFTLIKLTDEIWGKTDIHSETYTDIDPGCLRGSSAPINCQTWLAETEHTQAYWLMTAHSSVRKENGLIAYIHKFILLTEDFKVYRLSRYYKLTPELVEYSMGCILLDDKLVVSYSQDDRLGCLAVLNRDQVLRCFS